MNWIVSNVVGGALLWTGLCIVGSIVFPVGFLYLFFFPLDLVFQFPGIAFTALIISLGAGLLALSGN